MKKIFLFLGFIVMLSGCGKFTDKDLLKELSNKVEKSKNYQITATLEIFRNEEKFTYDVDYVHNISFLLDVKIILKTVKTVFKREDIGIRGKKGLIDFDVYRESQWEERRVR